VTLQRIADALEGLPIRGILTTGAVAPGAIRVPANIEVHQYLPHDEIMPSVSLVVGHGGHSTTMRGLVHGVPLLILPMHWASDQQMIGNAVAAAGVGLALPKAASAKEIRTAVQLLLDDPSYRNAATAIGARIRACNWAITAADELENLRKVPLAPTLSQHDHARDRWTAVTQLRPPNSVHAGSEFGARAGKKSPAKLKRNE
jgi:UDP:flavonoid glycosyltransferase YjiC (YdhE family)